MEVFFKNPHLDGTPKLYRGDAVGVLLLHGYTATPVEVDWLAKKLNQRGLTVLCPLLPGHGTKLEDLHRYKWEDWVEHADHEYRRLSSYCEIVFVGGESLGGLISLVLAFQHTDIKGLLLYAPALIPRNRFAHLARIFRYFVKSTRKKRAGVYNPIVEDRWQGYTLDSIPAVAQVVALQHYIRGSLPKVKHPTLIIQGRRDQTIRAEGAEEIYAKLSSSIKELVWLENSTHCVLLDNQREEAARHTIAFIDRVLSCANNNL